MSDPVPEKKEAPPPPAAPPSLVELLELSLTALVNAPDAFARLAPRPSARPGAAFLTALAWGVVFFALNLVHAAIASPGRMQGFAPWQLGAVAFLGLAAWTVLYLLASGLVYGLGRALGSEGGFDRALVVAAAALAAAPLQALCGWLPAAWPAPTVVAAWITACGLNALFKAEPWTARGVCAVFAAGALAVQYGAGLALAKYAAAAGVVAAAAQSVPSTSELADLQRQMERTQALSAEAMQAAAEAGTPTSSLDLLRLPDAGEEPAAASTAEQKIAHMSRQGEKASAAGDEMGKNVIAMLDSFAPMLNNPAITRNMTPQQKADYVELNKMITDLKNDIGKRSIVPPQEQQAQIMKIQALVMRIVSSGVSIPEDSPPANSTPAAKPKK